VSLPTSDLTSQVHVHLQVDSFSEVLAGVNSLISQLFLNSQDL
jgi:hypothetical protein